MINNIKFDIIKELISSIEDLELDNKMEIKKIDSENIEEMDNERDNIFPKDNLFLKDFSILNGSKNNNNLLI